jgi:hypothetical protein
VLVSPTGGEQRSGSRITGFKTIESYLKVAGYDDVEAPKSWSDLNSLFPNLNAFRCRRIIITIGNLKDARLSWRRKYRHSQISAENRRRGDTGVADESGKND